MLANQRQAPQSPGLPTSKATAKYTNKDGSKFITIPKVVNGSDSAQPSPSMPDTTTKTNGQMAVQPRESSGAPPVNRKKQKRRQKQAAKLAAEQLSNGAQKQMQDLEARFREHGLDERPGQNGQYTYQEGDDPYYSEDEANSYSGSYGHDGSSINGYAIPPPPPPAPTTTPKKSKKKKKSKGNQAGSTDNFPTATNGISNDQSPQLPPLQPSTQRGPGISKEKIWNTSSQEERERIKEFWLSLGEDERKSLVKVEKDAVLKKMKEQQKHSCSCTVCGRKRTAIEEELEVLYDAYYEELEQYANHQQGDGPPMIPPPRRFGAMNGLQPPNRLPPAFHGRHPSRGRIVEQLGDEEDDEIDDEYSEDDVDDDDYSEDEPEELPRGHATDFFNFGNSLTVQGGILTVADDLLKNDGKKFIEMMEQLAERRMAREEDAREQYANSYGHPPNLPMHTHNHTHNHPPLPDEEEYDDEEEEEDDYDSQDEDYDEEEIDTMTEEQRMEEGRRMFQIFAARMFEQRVLTAYKEKVAKERQQKLLEELEEESRADSQKKAKKAKDAQKRKDKLQQKKQALAEEKARKEAEKAAEEAALREAEAKKAEEQRLKAEEKRKKKEAQKKAEEEERLRKEAEKQRRIQEQRERQAEIERKAREIKERERKEKEEQRQREKEAREAKDREARERKEKLEREKKEKEVATNAKDQASQQPAVQVVTPILQVSKRAQPSQSGSLPTNVHGQPTVIASPHIPVAIPAVPKAPTPMKLRTSSQQESNSSVPATPQTANKSTHDSPNTSTPSQDSPGPIGPLGKAQGPLPFLHHPQATSPMHSALKAPPGMLPGSFVPPLGMSPFQPGMPPVGAPGFGSRMHHDPIFAQAMGGQFRPPNGMPMHPGIMPPVPQGRGFSLPHGPPGFPPQLPNGPFGGIGQPFGLPKDAGPPPSHSRQSSASYDKPFESHNGGPPAQPIARPAPIGRPASVVHGQRPGDQMGKPDMDDLSNHLGSSALLDDSDEPIAPGSVPRRMSGMSRQSYIPSVPFGIESAGFPSPLSSYNTWGTPPNPFGTSLPGSSFMGGWPPVNGSFSSVGAPPPIRPTQPRSVAIRLMMIKACRNLQGSTSDGFFDINAVKEQMDLLHVSRDESVSEKELLDICDTEGNSINGGGSFDVRNDAGHISIRYESDAPVNHRPVGAPGEIGSPIVGSGGISRFPGPPPGLTQGGF
ncbi:salt tolerance down-regulator-domain-containing protein [Xylogone sp. PMI_703]|nr:salt tolerance down-regulator-domain-containing protein [Xylogone sp. PMI_703]